MGKGKQKVGEKLSVNESREDNQLLSPSKEGKGKRIWKEVKYQLVEYHSLPGYLKDNEYILGHYRAEWPLKQALLSIFTIHNETLNVWTHLVGFFLFLALTIYTATKVPKVVDLHSLQNLPDVLRKADLHKLQAEFLTCLPSLPHMPDLHKLRDGLLLSPSNWHIIDLLTNCLPERFSHSNHTDVCLLRSVKEDVSNILAPLLVRPITRWPFYAFLGGAMFCLLASSTCHLLSCHSESLSYIMLRLDYAGIADINFILSSRLLFLHVLPLLLQSVPGIYYPPWNWHDLGLPTSCVPDPRISSYSGIPILWNGPVRGGTYPAQAGIVLAPT